MDLFVVPVLKDRASRGDRIVELISSDTNNLSLNIDKISILLIY